MDRIEVEEIATMYPMQTYGQIIQTNFFFQRYVYRTQVIQIGFQYLALYLRPNDEEYSTLHRVCNRKE